MVNATARRCSPRTTNEFYHDVDRMLSHVFGGFQSEGTKTDLTPAWDVAETENGYELYLELPGLKSEEVEIEAIDDALVIKGEKKVERNAEGTTFHRVERRAGSFERQLRFKKPVDFNAVEARLSDGILLVTIPKAEQALPKKIEIQ